MANTPLNPKAGVAGPGPFSVRTDQLRMGSNSYGEGKDTQAILSGSPLAKGQPVRGAQGSQVREAAASAGPVTPLFAPTQRPDEPITAGISLGEGPGPEVLGANMSMNREKISDVLAKMLPYDETGEIAILYQRAASRGM